MRCVAWARAASVVHPSRHGPDWSWWIGSKWSNDQADSKISVSSAARHMASMSDHVVASGDVLIAKRMRPSWRATSEWVRGRALCQPPVAMDDAIPTLHELFDPRLAEFIIGGGGDLMKGLPAYLGLRVVRMEPGVAVVECDVRPELVHGFGVTHGGVVATLVDQALGSAVFPLLPRGTWPATLEFKLNYLS